MTSPPRAPARKHPWLMYLAAIFGFAASTGLALFGWASLTGFASLEARAAFIVLALVTVACEIGAARYLVHAHDRKEEGAKSRSMGARVAFLLTTGFIVAGSHFGIEAIQQAHLGKLRAPIAARMAEADAALLGALRAEDKFEARSKEERARMMEAAPGPGAKRADVESYRADMAALREAQRVERAKYEDASDAAQRRAAQAQAALDAAPKPFGLAWIIAIAAMIELSKGVSVWVSTPRPPARKAETPAFDAENVRRLVAAMSDDDLDAFTSRGAQQAAFGQQEKRRREKNRGAA